MASLCTLPRTLTVLALTAVLTGGTTTMALAANAPVTTPHQSGVLNRSMAKAGAVPVAGATEAALSTPPEVARGLLDPDAAVGESPGSGPAWW